MLQFNNFSKKVFCCISLAFGLSFVQMSQAQITLEHTFLNERVNFNIGLPNGQPNYFMDEVIYPESSFYFSEVLGNSYHIKIYNPDYSLHSNLTYNFTPPAGYKVAAVFPSKNLYNTDDNYEFVVTFIKTTYVSYDNEYYKVILYDINGNVIKDFGLGNSLSVNSYFYIINNQYKLIVYRTVYDANHISITQSEIYSVPGTPPSTALKSATISTLQAYPNPANTIVTLPYQLKQGETSVMRIYNMDGQLIESKQLDSVFDKILLNVSGYPKGVYVFEVKGVSSRFVVN